MRSLPRLEVSLSRSRPIPDDWPARAGLCITGRMPFHRPIPDDRQSKAPESPSGARPRRGTNSLVQAEQVMQIAFVLPCAMLVGWGMGWGVDKLSGSHWAVVPGLILGLVAGMVSAIRMAMAAMKGSGGGE